MEDEKRPEDLPHSDEPQPQPLADADAYPLVPATPSDALARTPRHLLAELVARYPQPPARFERGAIIAIIDIWIQSHEPGEQRPRKHPKPRRSIDDVPADERAAIDTKLWCLLDIFARKILYQRVLPKGTLPQALAVLQCKERQAEKRMEQLSEQILDYPTLPERWGEVLLDSRGRPKGSYSKASRPEDALALLLSIINRERTLVHHDGTRSVAALQPGIDIPEDVREFVEALRGQDLSVDAYRLRVVQLLEQHPAFYALITEGESVLRRDHVPKIQFQTDAIDEIWQWDACDLPKYMTHGGEVCTAVWLRLIEADTDFHLNNYLIPKLAVDESGAVFPVSFTVDDAAVFLIETMRKHNRRPRYLHNDQGSNFLALRDRLPLVTLPGEVPLEMAPARPEEPWGKGLTETGFGHRLWRLLKRGGGYFSKSERAAYRKVEKDPKKLSSSATVQADLHGFCDDLNTWPRVQEQVGTAPTRITLYAAFISPLPCPPIRRLYYLLSHARRRAYPVQPDHLGFDFAEGGEKHWVPIPRTREELPDLYLRWMNASVAKTACAFVAIRLTAGWIGEICLDGVWYEVVPRSRFPFTKETHLWARDEAISRLKQQKEETVAQAMAAGLAAFGAFPEQLVATVRGHYQMPSDAAGTEEAATATPPALTDTASMAVPPEVSQPAPVPVPMPPRKQRAGKRVAPPATASGIDWGAAFQQPPTEEPKDRS